MSSSKGGKGGRYKHKSMLGERSREAVKDIDESNPVIAAFRIYAGELDAKHDRYERIFKLSRDITIESKRIIFLLHNVDKENKRKAILEEAETRLNNLITGNFKNIAVELESQDCYMYVRAYSAGLQEFIEAYTFYHYIKDGSIPHWRELESQLVYDEGVRRTLLPPLEFLLGVGDLTGELMRHCINNLATAHIQDCFRIAGFVKDLYTSFLLVSGAAGSKELSRKVYTLKLSLNKMEAVCYTVVVRGSEVPKHMLADVAAGTSQEHRHDDDDEGFY